MPESSLARRAFLGALATTAISASWPGFAQPRPSAVYRIGFLGSESASNQASRLEALRAGLRDLGYVEGRNIVIEVRWAEGRYDRLPALAAELIGLKVSVVVSSGAKATRAMSRATTTVPIVVETGDVVVMGVVTNLARPGGNVTGWTFFGPEITAKRLELLKEAVPSITQVAFLINQADPPTGLQAIETTARTLKLGLSQFRVHGLEEIDGTFAGMIQKRIDAVVVQGDTMFVVNAKAIADLALKYRLPTAGTPEFAQAGGVLGSGADLIEGHRRAAAFVDKILKGANPGDLPIEQATKFQLVINLGTAKALGLKIPQALVLRADTLIE